MSDVEVKEGLMQDADIDAFLARHGDVDVAPSLKEGTVVGCWRVTGFLGRGGSAEVYCAKSEATGEVAALKMLHRLEQKCAARAAAAAAKPATPSRLA